MSKTTDLKTDTANARLAPVDADIAALAGAARGLLVNDFVGVPLKFTKGKWTKSVAKDKGEAVGDTAPFVVDILSYACGWVKWENRKPVFKHVFRPVDGFILPPRDRLPDQDKDHWPVDASGKRADPWQENHQLVLKDVTADELVTWTTTSWYGRKAVGRLLDAYTREAKRHPGMMPVVLLSSRDEHSADYGFIPTPVLTLVEWRAFGDGAAPPGSPAMSSTVPALEAQPTPSLLATEKPSRSSASVRTRSDMDDEIPF